MIKPHAILITISTLAAACSPMVYDRGVPNFVQVGPGLWRSGQITTREGWDHVLETAHVTAAHLHVIKLNDDSEARDNPPAGVDVHYLPIPPRDGDVPSIVDRPDPERLARIERYLETATESEVWLVHCSHGQDRTGLVIGRYRVVHDGWSKRAALREMLAHHFHPELVGLLWSWIDDELVPAAVPHPITVQPSPPGKP